MASQIEHTRDQLSEQENANSQLTEMIQAEREKYKVQYNENHIHVHVYIIVTIV